MLTVHKLFSSHPQWTGLHTLRGACISFWDPVVTSPKYFLSPQLLSQVCLPCCQHPFGRGFHRLIPTVWQTHPFSGLWAWPLRWWPRFTVPAGAVNSQYPTALPRPCLILQNSGKCPFRLPWITSFQMKSHNIFTFTSMDAVLYVKNFFAIHCPCFSSALPWLSCRSQNCTQTFTCGHTVASGTLIASVPSALIYFL